MKPAIEYWRGTLASYGWPLDDPATGEPMSITGLSFRVRIFLDAGEIVLPGYGAAGRPLIEGKEVLHPSMLMVDIGPEDIEIENIEAGPGRYSLGLEVNDTSGWQVLPICDQSIIVR